MSAVGIDIGTSASCVAVRANGQVQVVPNCFGNYASASYVLFTDTEVLAGEAAKRGAKTNLESVCPGVKMLLAKGSKHPDVIKFQRNTFVNMIDDDGTPKVNIASSLRTFEEITGLLLKELKNMAENYLDKQVTKAVLTVPASFTEPQRRTYIDLAKNVGFQEVSLLSDTVAAASQFIRKRRSNEDCTFVVVDFGASKCDMSAFTFTNTVLQTLATVSDDRLGGDELTENLVNHFVQQLEDFENLDIKQNRRALFRLREECEEVKCKLSRTQRAVLNLKSAMPGVILNTTVQRSDFEKMNYNVFQGIADLLTKLLQQDEVRSVDIDEIVLIGGSSVIPKFQSTLQTSFNGKTLNHLLDLKSNIASGAAVHAEQAFPQLPITSETHNRIPVSIGIELLDRIVSVVIKRGTELPATGSVFVTTSKDKQTKLLFRIYACGETKADRGKMLAEFWLNNIEQADCRVPKIEVEFKQNGVLTVSARGTELGRIDIGGLEEELNVLGTKEVEFEKEDRELVENIKYMNRLEHTAHRLKMKCSGDLQAKCLDIIESISRDRKDGNYREKNYYEEERLKLLKSPCNTQCFCD
ncbi:hypothetical protein PHET_01108 [Paragonimus heterotremus]|uniref:Uncharacterized protein n=1 Tax=Paragonimus heterotremus TaxID=100268 RepID=A0A8J4TEE1_9TREM|nr:hypothetical protein PHET_01108 [Paragonimus heterotremus]